MKVEDFCKWLESAGFKDGDRLPSVRDVASSSGASTCTVFRAYKKMVEEGKIYAEHGNGHFWGRKPEFAVDVHERESDRLERLLLEAWKSGRISTNGPLPSIKELSSTFETLSSQMQRALEALRGKGVLKRRGKGRYYFVSAQPFSMKSKEILLIMRCNPSGDFNCLGERELLFVQKVYAEAHRNNLKVKLLGYLEKTGAFLDASGNRVEMENFRECFGAIISTMLVFNMNRLFAELARIRFPVAVWWEHSLSMIPRALKSEKRYAFFNLAFGEFPGRAVGRFLKERGVASVAYVSPYHSSSWSIDRLHGLKRAGLQVYEATDATHASPFDFMRESRSKSHFRSILLSLAKTIPPVDAWVVANDYVGAELLSLIKQGKLKKPPYMVSFDNSTDSYRIRLDSFEFNFESLAAQSVYHLISPGVTLYKSNDFRELSGRVVEK